MEDTMNAFLKLTWVDTRLFLRNTIGAFFILVFPILMLFVFGAMYGNKPTSLFNGLGSVDVSVPGYIVSLVIGTSGFLNLPIELAIYRERGILRRYRATPLKPGWVLGSQTVVILGSALVGTLIQIGLGVGVYHMHLPEAPFAVLLGFILISVSTFATGFLFASLVRTASTARSLGMAIYYPMMFLCGGTLPRELMPDTLKRIADFLPLTHAVSLFKDLWFGRGWNLVDVAILAGVGVVSAYIAVRLFRWE
jgi:ABC-2 type transport system permease protein